MCNSDNLIYTGVGSRKVPSDISFLLSCLSSLLESKGYILRSGGAIGCDTAFENGVQSNNNKHIYLTKADKFSNQFIRYTDNQIRNARMFIIDNNVHPMWINLGKYDKELHTRNIFQVLGVDMNIKSKFLICWTRDGAHSIDECTRSTGGTATAIKVACLNNIPVFNLGYKPHFDRIISFLRNNLDDKKMSQLNKIFPLI